MFKDSWELHSVFLAESSTGREGLEKTCFTRARHLPVAGSEVRGSSCVCGTWWPAGSVGGRGEDVTAGWDLDWTPAIRGPHPSPSLERTFCRPLPHQEPLPGPLRFLLPRWVKIIKNNMFCIKGMTQTKGFARSSSFFPVSTGF